MVVVASATVAMLWNYIYNLGFDHAMLPTWTPSAIPFLEAGGTYALAVLRGGGEYGEKWHRAGMLESKQNVFDDFVAAAEWLIANKVTSAARLAISGRSNGGLLVGAALTQRPDLFRAVVSYVGIYDMLRVELDPNGAFNVTEFGTAAGRSRTVHPVRAGSVRC